MQLYGLIATKTVVFINRSSFSLDAQKWVQSVANIEVTISHDLGM